MSIEGRTEERNTLKGTVRAIPLIDKTLTKDGQCADAKAVGDRLQEQEESLGVAISKTEVDLKESIQNSGTQIMNRVNAVEIELNTKIDEEKTRAEESEVEIRRIMNESDTAINESIVTESSALSVRIDDTNARLEELTNEVLGEEESITTNITDLSGRLNKVETEILVSNQKPMIKIVKTADIAISKSYNTFFPFMKQVEEQINTDSEKTLLSMGETTISLGDRENISTFGVRIGYGVSRVRVILKNRYRNN